MEPKNLKGVVPQGKIRLKDGAGNIGDPGKVVFPILKQVLNEGYHLIGTGFFVSIDGGIFVTAKHVLHDVFDENGKQTFPIVLMQLLDNNVFLFRPILRCTSHDVADISVGIAAPMASKTLGPLKNKALHLTSIIPPIGERICTYAFPRSVIKHGEVQELHMYADFFDGSIQEYFPNGRDSVLMPGPCMQTSMHVHGGASGGPVFNSAGKVIGVNSTGFEGDSLSFITPIMTIENLLLSDVKTPNNSSGKVRVKELIEDGYIVL